MRLLNRPLGRLSRHRRGPVAGLLVLLLGLLLTGGLYAAFSPAQAQADNSAAQVKQGRELFLVGCSFCHGVNGQGVKTLDGNQLGPSLVGVGAAAVDFQVGTGRMPAVQPGPQIPQKETSYTADEIAALSAYVASLGPGPAIPNESDWSLDGLSDAGASGGHLPRRPDLPDQLHGLPQLRGLRRRDAAGRLRAARSAASRRSTSSRRCSPGPRPWTTSPTATSRSRRSATSSPTSSRCKTTPSYGGFGLGGIGPVSEGMFAWLVGIGGLVGVAVWIAAHTARTSKTKAEAEA